MSDVRKVAMPIGGGAPEVDRTYAVLPPSRMASDRALMEARLAGRLSLDGERPKLDGNQLALSVESMRQMRAAEVRRARRAAKRR